LIKLTEICKRYDASKSQTIAVQDINLHINEGSFIALTGRSGSGKSTLLNLIAGLSRPTSGQIEVAGTHLNGLNENQLAQWRAQSVGIIFQFFQLLPTLTTLENVMLPMELGQQLSMKARREKAADILEVVGLANKLDDFPSELSGGQQQRVAIARAMANDPPLLLADEPTGNLDTQTAEAIFDIFDQMVSAGKTLVLVTHDLHFASRASKQIHLIDGQIV
jgi:putative ABC transport system ATP-binding protein